MKYQLILALVAAFGFASWPLAIAEFAESNISSDQVETNVGLFFSKISAPSNLRSQTYNDTTNPNVAYAPETSSTVLTIDGVDVNTTVASIEGVEVTNTVSSVDGVPVSTTVVSVDGVPVSTTVISVSDDPMSSAKVNLDEASFERAANDDARDIDPAESFRAGNFSLSIPLNDSLSSQPVLKASKKAKLSESKKNPVRSPSSSGKRIKKHNPFSSGKGSKKRTTGIAFPGKLGNKPAQKNVGKVAALESLNANDDGTTSETGYYNLAVTSSPSTSPSPFTSTTYNGATSETGNKNLDKTPSPSRSTAVDAYYYYYYPTASGTAPAE